MNEGQERKAKNAACDVENKILREPKVSIIIPSYNRKKYLQYVLPSYINQEFVKEIILIDDGSSENYSEIVEQFTVEAKKVGTEFIYIRHKQRKGAPAARNSGVKVINSELVLFSDDDVILSNSFVSKAIQKMIALRADIVGARLIPINTYDVRLIDPYFNTRKILFNYLTLTGHYYVNPGTDVEVPFVSAVGLWRKWIFDEGVRFDESYAGNGYREETSAQVEASKLGARIFFVPDLLAWHIRTERMGGQWRGSKFWWYSWSIKNNMKFLRKYYSYLKRKWNLKYPWWISFLIFSLRQLSVFIPDSIKLLLRKLLRAR
jgi:glycosyltransferase involved in cell wall biosynthesis